jgi:hypothetical protein
MVPALAIIPMVKYMKGNGIKTRELAEQKWNFSTEANTEGNLSVTKLMETASLKI